MKFFRILVLFSSSVVIVMEVVAGTVVWYNNKGYFSLFDVQLVIVGFKEVIPIFKTKTWLPRIIAKKKLGVGDRRVRMGSVAVTVASMLFSGGCRSLTVPAAAHSLCISRTALRNYRNKNAPSWCCRSSHNSYTALATESEFSKTNAESLTASTSSDRYLNILKSSRWVSNS